MESKSLNYKPTVIVLLIVIGLSVFILLKLKESGKFFSGAAQLKVGDPVPDFAYPGLDGKMVRLSAYKRKVVLLNIWATWCRPCVDEMPSMQKLYQDLRTDDFEILAVSIDADGGEAVAAFMQKHKLTFPALIDANASIRESYGVTGVPESFIIDQQGILVRKIIGAVDWSSSDVIQFFRDLIQNSQSPN